MKTQKTLLITGGTWYIGSHAVVAFEEAGYKTVIVDNLSNSSKDTLIGIEKILWYIPDFYEYDIGDLKKLDNIFQKYLFDGVIHFAGFKAVGESCDKPFKYYENNITGSIRLFEIMEQYGVRNIVFSSSATVYDPRNAPVYREWMSLGTTNPYGTAKLVIEQILGDLAKTKHWNALCLRYFNPIGAHLSGNIGENPQWVPNNLLPYILDVVAGKREYVRIFWDDYDTPDGTGIRDYINIHDLVNAHILAYQKMEQEDIEWEAINIGTGKGTSVLEMIHLVEKVTGQTIPYQVLPRREGDIAQFWCDPERAKRFLGWYPHNNIENALLHSYKYATNLIFKS